MLLSLSCSFTALSAWPTHEHPAVSPYEISIHCMCGWGWVVVSLSPRVTGGSFQMFLAHSHSSCSSRSSRSSTALRLSPHVRPCLARRPASRWEPLQSVDHYHIICSRPHWWCHSHLRTGACTPAQLVSVLLILLASSRHQETEDGLQSGHPSHLLTG